MNKESGTPSLSARAAEALVEQCYGLELQVVGELPSYMDQNFRLRVAGAELGKESGEGEKSYLLKISNLRVPRQDLEAQNEALGFLHRREIDVLVPRVVPGLDGRGLSRVETEQGAFDVRLLTWVPGQLLSRAEPLSVELLQSLGDLVARCDLSLFGFDHPTVPRDLIWDPAQATRVRELLPLIEDPNKRELAGSFLLEHETRVAPRLGRLRRSVIHGDPNPLNVLMADSADGPRAEGLIDFGDLMKTATVCDLAIATAYAMMGQEDPLEAAGRVVAGYHRILPLTSEEVEVLHGLICSRLVVSVAMAAKEKKSRADAAYVTSSEAPAWELLERLAGESSEEVAARFRAAIGCSPRSPTAKLSRSEILEARDRHAGANLSLSYTEPLEIVRGSMQYLYDRQGRAYLDLVNNVCHVGHCHPRVVAAAQRQMAVLNTNTRYLHDQLARYTHRLSATLPEPLEVCFLVCSGSEANDLALRLARAYTGSSDVICIDGAYHGHTNALIDISPYKFSGPGGNGLAEHVQVVPMPDGYRGLYRREGPNWSAPYVEHVAEAAASCRRRHGLAAFFAEALLGCGGQLELPAGFLEGAFRLVRDAGGVCVSDEVQIGFGRMGDHFWGFETQGVVPDIVTLGKPIGNGHPMAAVVTRREIAEAFANGMEYFNTFGGNPVSCAVGLAVLDVIEDEGLQERAKILGKRFKVGLDELSSRHQLIGEIRGRGLFLGVELVRDRETLEPAAPEAKAVIEEMKSRGILLSVDGPLHNVLKIKPPMVLTEQDIDRTLESLDRVLLAVG